MLTAEDVSVNGYMLDPYFSTSLAPGFTAFSDMYWNEEEFEENGIVDVEEIEFTLQVYDADIFDDDYLVEKNIILNP